MSGLSDAVCSVCIAVYYIKRGTRLWTDQHSRRGSLYNMPFGNMPHTWILYRRREAFAGAFNRFHCAMRYFTYEDFNL